MINWVFGVSSEFSQAIIQTLDGDTIQFGRNKEDKEGVIKVDYHPADVKDWVEDNIANLDTPDRIIFNINTGMVQELPSPMHEKKPVAEQFQIFNKWWADNRSQMFFKTYLMDYLISYRQFNKKVCFITSQISADHNPEWKRLHLYKNLRAVDYELIWTLRSKDCNAFGICPAANTRPLEWAEYIGRHIQTDTIGKQHWLYGVADTGKGLGFVKYSDWEITL